MNDEYDHRDGSFSLSHTTQNTHTHWQRAICDALRQTHTKLNQSLHTYTLTFLDFRICSMQQQQQQKKPEKNSREEKLCRAESVRE